MKSGVFMNDDMIANVCKHHVTKMPYEIGRLAQDLAGGIMTTAPSQKDLEHPEIGGIIRKYLKGRKEIPTEDRLRIARLIENMTMGRNAVGYLTESHAWRGFAAGAAHPDRPADAARVQETAREDARRHSTRLGRGGL